MTNQKEKIKSSWQVNTEKWVVNIWSQFCVYVLHFENNETAFFERNLRHIRRGKESETRPKFLRITQCETNYNT